MVLRRLRRKHHSLHLQHKVHFLEAQMIFQSVSTVDVRIDHSPRVGRLFLSIQRSTLNLESKTTLQMKFLSEVAVLKRLLSLRRPHPVTTQRFNELISLLDSFTLDPFDLLRNVEVFRNLLTRRTLLPEF